MCGVCGEGVGGGGGGGVVVGGGGGGGGCGWGCGGGRGGGKGGWGQVKVKSVICPLGGPQRVDFRTGCWFWFFCVFYTFCCYRGNTNKERRWTTLHKPPFHNNQ